MTFIRVFPPGQNRDQDYQAFQELLVVGFDIEQIEHVVDQGKGKHASEQALNRPAAATQNAAADHHSGDRIELVTDADARLRDAKPRGEQNAGKCGEQARAI